MNFGFFWEHLGTSISPDFFDDENVVIARRNIPPSFCRALTNSTHQKVNQMYDKTYPYMGPWSSSPNHLQIASRKSSWMTKNNDDTTTSTIRGSSTFKTTLAVASPFYYFVFIFSRARDQLLAHLAVQER